MGFTTRFFTFYRSSFVGLFNKVKYILYFLTFYVLLVWYFFFYFRYVLYFAWMIRFDVPSFRPKEDDEMKQSICVTMIRGIKWFGLNQVFLSVSDYIIFILFRFEFGIVLFGYEPVPYFEFWIQTEYEPVPYFIFPNRVICDPSDTSRLWSINTENIFIWNI